MRTEEEQADPIADELRAIARALRELEARAKRVREGTLAYLLDMAAIEAETAARKDEGFD